MQSSERREIEPRERVRLIGALVVLSGFVVLSAVGIGVALHGWAETHDSLEHWQAQLADKTDAPERWGTDSPASRIRRLEEELAAVPERLFALISVFVLMSVLVYLGYRVLRYGRRVA